MSLIGKLRRRWMGSYKAALRDGMKAGKGVSVMGSVNFGSEPYLITIEDDVRISFSVVTKDIPDGCVAVGVPARVVMTTEEYAQKCKEGMKPYDQAAYAKDKKNYLSDWL